MPLNALFIRLLMEFVKYLKSNIETIVTFGILLLLGGIIFFYFRTLSGQQISAWDITLFFVWVVALIISQIKQTIGNFKFNLTKDQLSHLATMVLFISASFLTIGAAFIVVKEELAFGKLILSLGAFTFFGAVAFIMPLFTSRFEKSFIAWGLATLLANLFFFLYLIYFLLVEFA